MLDGLSIKIEKNISEMALKQVALLQGHFFVTDCVREEKQDTFL